MTVFQKKNSTFKNNKNVAEIYNKLELNIPLLWYISFTRIYDKLILYMPLL